MEKQTENIKEIANRIQGLREIMDIEKEELAERLGMTVEEYSEYEEGKVDFSFSFLYEVADELGINITDLIMGDSGKLHIYSYVPAGEGIVLQRRQEYVIQHLGYLFRNKKMEPFVVTVDPSDIYSGTHKKSHVGQEFNYVLEGSMTLFVGDESIYMNEGDSIIFDSEYPHSMQAENGKRCRYLAVIAK